MTEKIVRSEVCFIELYQLFLRFRLDDDGAPSKLLHDPVHGIADANKVFVRDAVASDDLGPHLADPQSGMGRQIDQGLIGWCRVSITEKFATELRFETSQ
jgi:hypothetical protein